MSLFCERRRIIALNGWTLTLCPAVKAMDGPSAAQEPVVTPAPVATPVQATPAPTMQEVGSIVIPVDNSGALLAACDTTGCHLVWCFMLSTR